jgi:hypothetical protein
MVGFLARGHVDLAITAPGLTEPGLDGTSCRSSACASWFRAIIALRKRARLRLAEAADETVHRIG